MYFSLPPLACVRMCVLCANWHVVIWCGCCLPRFGGAGSKCQHEMQFNPNRLCLHVCCTLLRVVVRARLRLCTSPVSTPTAEGVFRNPVSALPQCLDSLPCTSFQYDKVFLYLSTFDLTSIFRDFVEKYMITLCFENRTLCKLLYQYKF